MRPRPRKGHLVVMHIVQLHHVWVRLAKPQGGHFSLCVRLQPGGEAGGVSWAELRPRPRPPASRLCQAPPTPPAAEDLDGELLAALALAAAATHGEAALAQRGLPQVQLVLLEEGRVLAAKGARQRSYLGALRPRHAPPANLTKVTPSVPGEARSGIPEPRHLKINVPPWPNPPASWRSWPRLPGRAGLQRRTLPGHRSSSPRCYGRTGWRAPRRSIPAGVEGAYGHRAWRCIWSPWKAQTQGEAGPRGKTLD